MELRFPLTGGGEEQGLKHAGVETFEGNLVKYLARECAQNTGDAVRSADDTAELSFELLQMPLEDIPCVDQLARTFKACKDFKKLKNEKASTVYDHALEYLKKDSIPVLRISDRGTTGLAGADLDRDGKWYALVRSAGVSIKDDEGSGGAFGFGKFSPFASSAIRTVFYSTMTQDGDYAFQGVVRVASHRDPYDHVTQGTGYIGDYNEELSEFCAIRQFERIPMSMRRYEIGTDIYIPAFKAPEKWQELIQVSILNNFWPAIHMNKITFSVGQETINATNLKTWIYKLRGTEDFEAANYYKAIVDPSRKEFSAELKHVGHCRLFLVEGNEDQNKKSVAMIRKNAMIITYWDFMANKPLSGLFVCDDDRGNLVLKAMEPPRHDDFEEHRIENGKAVRAEIRKWIREKIQSILPKATGKSFEFDDMAKYLPDDVDEDDLDTFESGETDVENLDAVPAESQKKETPPPVVPKPPIISKPTVEPPEDYEDEEPPHGPGTKTRKRHKRIRLGFRSVHLGGSEYRLVLRSSVDRAGRLTIMVTGDDGSYEKVDVVEVTDSQDELEVNDGEIDFLLTAGDPKFATIRLDSDERLSLQGVAYEAQL